MCNVIIIVNLIIDYANWLKLEAMSTINYYTIYSFLLIYIHFKCNYVLSINLCEMQLQTKNTLYNSLLTLFSNLYFF